VDGRKEAVVSQAVFRSVAYITLLCTEHLSLCDAYELRCLCTHVLRFLVPATACFYRIFAGFAFTRRLSSLPLLRQPQLRRRFAWLSLLPSVSTTNSASAAGARDLRRGVTRSRYMRLRDVPGGLAGVGGRQCRSCMASVALQAQRYNTFTLLASRRTPAARRLPASTLGGRAGDGRRDAGVTCSATGAAVRRACRIWGGARRHSSFARCCLHHA